MTNNNYNKYLTVSGLAGRIQDYLKIWIRDLVGGEGGEKEFVRKW